MAHGNARALASLLVAIVIAACGGPSGPTRIPLPPGRAPLPDASPACPPAPSDVVCVAATVALHGILHEENGCIWYTLANEVNYRVVWPFGYSADFDPFVVYNNSGMPVARDGDLLLAGGWAPEPGEPDLCGRSIFVTLADVPNGIPDATIPP